jgi:solute carrier family 45 protein 1/2/4
MICLWLIPSNAFAVHGPIFVRLFPLSPSLQYTDILVFPKSSWIAWFPVLFYSSTWVGDIYKTAAIANGRAEDDPTLSDEAIRAGSVALLYSSVLSFAISVVAPFFIRPNRTTMDGEPKGATDKLKISLGGLWSVSQAIFACSMMATL